MTLYTVGINNEPKKAGTIRMADTGTMGSYGDPILSNLKLPGKKNAI